MSLQIFKKYHLIIQQINKEVSQNFVNHVVDNGWGVMMARMEDVFRHGLMVLLSTSPGHGRRRRQGRGQWHGIVTTPLQVLELPAYSDDVRCGVMTKGWRTGEELSGRGREDATAGSRNGSWVVSWLTCSTRVERLFSGSNVIDPTL